MGKEEASLWGNTALSVKAVTEIFAALLMVTVGVTGCGASPQKGGLSEKQTPTSELKQTAAKMPLDLSTNLPYPRKQDMLNL